MGRKKLEPASVEILNSTMSRMLVPEYILSDFDMYGAREFLDSWVIEIREKAGKIPVELSDCEDVVFDGYCNPIETLSHSFSLKPIYLKAYRRRYKRAGANRHYSNVYDLSLKGVKMEPSMGIFFKKKIEEAPVNLSVVARMYEIKPKRLYHAYKKVLSDYRSDIASETWKSKTIESVNKKTGEIKELPFYVFEPQHIGARMSIDDKGTGRDGFTIFSNGETSKIALMVESTKQNQTN